MLDKTFIENKCNNYSYAFRRMYKMIDESSDVNFIIKFKNTFNLNDIEYRSLLNDVKSFKDRDLVIYTTVNLQSPSTPFLDLIIIFPVPGLL
jgi:hypothetical protein